MAGRAKSKRSAPIGEALLAHALSLPGAWEDHPWGERVAKVGKKVFVFLGKPEGDESFGLSCKLPDSGAMALMLPFAEPTGYGLGKAGWVSANFTSDADVPVEMLEGWIDESYRAVAPKKLVKRLDEAQRAEGPQPSKTERAKR